MEKIKTVVIVGAGVSGLSAGIYAEQNGMHAVIVEKNPSVGGLCTGWYRQGKYVDGCIHWLTGSKKGTALYNSWVNVGAFKDKNDLIFLDSWGSFEYEGTTVTFWTDLERTREEMLKISPQDKKLINKFIKIVKDIASVEEPLEALPSMNRFSTIMSFVFDVLAVFPSYLLTMNMTCERFAASFKHPALKWAFERLQPGDGNLFSMLFSYAILVKGNGGIPKGGSKPMVERMKEKFLSLGGTLILNKPVKKILFEKKTAIGVETESGEVFKGDYIITATDAYYAMDKLLDNKFTLSKIMKGVAKYQKKPCPSGCTIFYEIEDLPKMGIPHSFAVEPFVVGQREIDHLTLRSYEYDPDTFVRGNKVIVSTLLDQYGEDYETWKSYKEQGIYEAKKKEVSDAVLERIYTKYPELKGKITVLDMFTPLTLNRYTNATRGGYMTFLMTKKNSMSVTNPKMPGVKNLYLAGQWMWTPGGLPFALSCGKFAIQKILKKERQKYLFKYPILVKK